MPETLRPLPYRKVARALKRLGFHRVRQVGSHVRFQHDDGRAVTVPKHPGEDIGRGLLKKILRDANVAIEDLLREV